MYEQGSQVRIALLADAPEPPSLAGGVFARGEAKPAGEVAAGGKALDVDHRGTQRGGGERSDARDLQQPLDNGIVFIEARELAIDLLAALLEGVDLGE